MFVLYTVAFALALLTITGGLSAALMMRETNHK
jgi:hypothetical protein